MKIIVISGTPGTGKTTVSNILSNMINGKVISLNQLAISENYIVKYDKKRNTKVINTEKLLQYVISLIKNFKQSNEQIILIEGHFADIIPNEFIDVAIVLRCDPYELMKRLDQRNYSKEKVIENVQSEILGNCANFLFQKSLDIPIYEIDTSKTSPTEISEKILKIINKTEIDEDLSLGKIDWLEELFKKDKIGDFFN
ncbi:MAG: adenylate kinase family protein [Candidatus Hermodarchaeota archaeon]